MNYTEFMQIVCMICVAVIAVVLAYIIKKGYVGEDALAGLQLIMKAIPKSNNGLVNDIITYAGIAVRTVEQLVKTGELQKDNHARQMQAVEIVQEMIATEYGDNVMEDVHVGMIQDIVDAEVHKLPRNN